MRFGEKQLGVVCAMTEGATLHSIALYDKKNGANSLRFKGVDHRLKTRDLLRLMSKGCIKIKSVITNRVDVAYQYELTTHFKNILPR